MSKQIDFLGHTWLTLQTLQALSSTLPSLMEMRDGCFSTECSSALSNPSRPEFLRYPKAKSSTLNVPTHPLYLWIFQNFKTLLKFFFLM